MASAQVLPSSRKQELAEAGRRKLEQFRKQKAAERAKKASSNSRAQPVDSKIGQQRASESDGAVTSMSDVPVGLSAENHQVSSNDIHSKSSSSRDGDGLSSSSLATSDERKEYNQKDDASPPVGAVDFSGSIKMKSPLYDLTEPRKPEGIPYNMDKQGIRSNDGGFSLRESDGVNKPIPPFPGNTRLPSISTQTESFSYGGGLTSSNEGSLQPTTKMTGSIFEVAKNRQGNSELEGSMEQKSSLSSSYLFSLQDTSSQPFESSDFSLNIRSSSPVYTAKNENNARRSRPSFLDSLNISRSSEHQHAEAEAGLTTSGGSQLTGGDGLGLAYFQNLTGKKDTNGPFSAMGAPTFTNRFESSQSSLFPAANGTFPSFSDFPVAKQNEDFAALEQHIEDLTQEKFSLQRALEASRALAESLASENSSLTDTYNQQRSIVNQLKDEMEKLQQQIQANMVELESMRMEYTNAQLECNAADERAKILAAEVVSLEDKALRLRSNELKLERELENAQAEMSSYKKKISSLEKDRQDLQSSINALQEEKKLLQTMLRKASPSGKSVDLGKAPTSRKEASTSTEDLAMSDNVLENFNQETHATTQSGSDSSFTTMAPDRDQLALEGSSLSIPPDHMRMVQNINTLITELAVEKDELMQALSAESSQTARLKELNKELSRKLEIQTQRLELLTAQNMAISNITSTKQPDSHLAHEITPIADEGDEVVERVLGWIMKLFPGGPSRRRTSKLI
ncbi:PREDICTED: golgin subfamily A member 2-like [Tarenaya hassleriana]|uniref:golgin subfamily A member 2-like n=1 Tax=Tarenaya hassleriana TaxID=28532 RepID=UPI00053C724E|nr:PREDICTED: golgin subfamily A member 2-like [Tarenaya hassleriana]